MVKWGTKGTMGRRTVSPQLVRAHCSPAQSWPQSTGHYLVPENSWIEGEEKVRKVAGAGHTTGEQRVSLCSTTASSSQQLLSGEKGALDLAQRSANTASVS